jgi:GT2 family glycosyltransferase
MPRALSVIIPTYNRRESLRRCLDSLTAQVEPPPFEVIVVDDGSEDGTAEALARYPSRHPLRVLTTERAGPATARNLGAAEAGGEYLLFIDDDVVTHPDLLATHMSTHEAEPECVVVGPMISPAGERLSSWVRWEQEVLDKQYEAMLKGKWGPSPRQFYTANASLARRHFEASGGFDSTYRRAEDVELGYRLRDMGLRFVFQPDAVVTHYAGRTLSGWWRIPYQYGVNDVRMSRDEGHGYILGVMGREFPERHRLVQRLIRLLIGGAIRSRAVAAPAVGLAVVAGGVGLSSLSRWTYSLAYNLLYYQGVCDELGSVAAFRSVIDGRSRGSSAGADSRSDA